jgi:TorA maturation chaperone TorD/DNA-binding transcriptional regulator YdaS (Cro superfamily)
MGGTALAQAIEIVGGQAALARLLGVSQPTVWHWVHKAERVPGEHVIAIETVTGGRVSRHDLRPDLYPSPGTDKAPPADAASEEDTLRADVYRLLASLLIAPPSAERLAVLGRMVGDTSPLGQAYDALAAAARATDAQRVEREHFHLFVGMGRGELMPYGSYYLTGFLYERPLAKLRADLARLGIARAEGTHEPEDHAGILCETMAGLASGRLGRAVGLAEQNRFFHAHLGTWMPRFFADLEKAEAASFYRPVGTIGRLFMSIESEAFALAA